MKTLVLSEVFPPRVGGSGRWLWEIYRRLPNEDYVLAVGEHPRQEEFDGTHDLRLLRMPLSFSTWGIASLAGCKQYGRTAWALRRLVRREGIGMVHCGKCLPEGLLAWFLKKWCGVPYLSYVHGEELTLAAMSRELAWWTRRVLHGAAFVIANSRNTEGLLRDGWDLPTNRVRVLHPGVDTQRFRPAPRDSGWRRQRGWNDRPVLLTVSRLQKRKGHDQMILALRAIQQRFPEILYAIVGDGEERTDLEALVHRENLDRQVQFLGELPDEEIVACYEQCDLFVLPNRQVGHDIEGFGMVLLEAQACGKPVLAGASGGTAEAMWDGQTGFVLDCKGTELLAMTAIELLSDRQRLSDMGTAARQWVVDHFDWSVLSRKASELFGGENVPQKECLAEVTTP